jgi:Flp pilus assembly protein TadD
MNPLLASLAILAVVLDDGNEATSPFFSRLAVTVQRPLSPEDEKLLASAGREFAMGNFSECLKVLEPASVHPEVLNLRGAAMAEMGKKENAAALFQWALELDPQHFWARYNLAEIALLAGEPDRARKQFLVLPQRSPAEQELVKLKLLLVDLRLDDEASARRQLPAWPPATAAGYAAYAALAHREGDDARRAAILSESRRLHPDEWGIFLKKTLLESGIPTD